MHTVELYAQVRRQVMVEGTSQRATARQFGISREMVSKMLRHVLPPGYRRTAAVIRPKLDSFLGWIEPKHGGSPTIGARARCHYDAKVVTSRGLSTFHSQDVRCSEKKFFQQCGPSRWRGPLLRSG